jgi:hypothetical protein
MLAKFSASMAEVKAACGIERVSRFDNWDEWKAAYSFAGPRS